jgi:hypothetical protein
MLLFSQTERLAAFSSPNKLTISIMGANRPLILGEYYEDVWRNATEYPKSGFPDSACWFQILGVFW